MLFCKIADGLSCHSPNLPYAKMIQADGYSLLKANRGERFEEREGWRGGGWLRVEQPDDRLLNR